MSYYHIHIVLKGKDYYEFNQTEEGVKKLTKLYMQGKEFAFNGIFINSCEIEEIRICETTFTKRFFENVWDDTPDVTRNFIKFPPQGVAKRTTRKTILHDKDVFIVHGKDHKPMKELKVMLKEFGLNPIVLHEQPGGSRTIVEKLEKYSDVGYAFVILTPDDSGCEKVSTNTTTQWAVEIEYFTSRGIDITENKILRNRSKEVVRMLKSLRDRARQNVILEFGYFIGLLGRDRICCLYKGNVELPSNMHGIVYIPFKESLNEVRNKIIKELKEAGYEIKA